MNNMIIAAALVAAFASPAVADEGGGDPFPLNVPGINTPAVSQGFDVGNQELPTFPRAYSYTFNGMPTFEQSGHEGDVETLNSLPRNALDGTIEYAQQQSIARWFASRATRGRLAQSRTARPGG